MPATIASVLVQKYDWLAAALAESQRKFAATCLCQDEARRRLPRGTPRRWSGERFEGVSPLKVQQEVDNRMLDPMIPIRARAMI